MATEKVNLSHDKIIGEVKAYWNQLAGKYHREQAVTNYYFAEIEKAYTASERYYHNLEHIHALLSLSNSFFNKLQEKDVVDFSIFYHDICYSATRNDNEERSANLALQRLEQLRFSLNGPIVVEYINATKRHKSDESQERGDIAWFLDFDLAVLGSDPETYKRYADNVRLEYRMYPDVLYNKGRGKFLQKMLESPFIFHTTEFRTSVEPQARLNIRRELNQL